MSASAAPADVATSSGGLDARVIVHRDGFRLDAAVQVVPGTVVALMGPSGAGKSTLLGALAGLVALDDGYVRLAGRTLDTVAPRPLRVAPSHRGIVLLGQDPRLFPHLTAHANIAFGLRIHGASKADAASQAEEWLRRVGLPGLGARRPTQLSGGQQQRVALARALATHPAALLLDEPLTSLDAETAGDVRALLHEQLVATGTTAIVATHDAVDAASLAHSLVVLEGGRVTQSGPVRDVLAEPATRFSAAVAGLNRVEGRIESGRWHSGALTLPSPGIDPDASSGRDTGIAAIFRPSAVAIDTGAAAGDQPDGSWQARVVRLEQTPSGVRVRTADPDIAVDVAAGSATGLTVGTTVSLRVDPADVRFVRARGEYVS
ncbi:ABC transporter ATP-binding protein [Microbacterium sp. HD4P20]|uniref:sulfate/molybdate ABC transporter ATP-binding protein n=1 Tax=Microbacterium sp. HD4P20 TaxID=2864874 RepID=UPI001C644541|nr:ABC transporter ATP-binding protein [Microbacterium sp. HD4P20]MCP2636410.1 ABC transporter ATP-binding protein [Microbacterium sp. HD4P20]